MSDDLKDDDEIKDKDEDAEIGEPDLDAISEEKDFAPTPAAIIEDEEVEDLHETFNKSVEVEDPHEMDIYGDGGVPGEEDDDEEDDDYDGDIDRY